MSDIDNPFSPANVSAATKALPPAGDVYFSRRASAQSDVASDPSNATGLQLGRPLMYAAGRRERRAGCVGFSIDPARLEAYRRRAAGCRGMADKADDDRRKAGKALDTQKYQARRFIANGQKVPTDLVARMKEFQVQSDAADANYAAVSEEIQGILSIAERIDKYIDERKQREGSDA